MCNETAEVIQISVTSPVSRGAKLLDSALPGWANKINVETLDLSGARMCILGQLYGSSEAGCKALGTDNHRSFRPIYGFEASSIGGYAENCARLKHDWLVQIAMRLLGTCTRAAHEGS